MNRRGFLSAIGAAVAGATLDSERLLWRPGAKLISIPKPAPKLTYLSVWNTTFGHDLRDNTVWAIRSAWIAEKPGERREVGFGVRTPVWPPMPNGRPLRDLEQACAQYERQVEQKVEAEKGILVRYGRT